MHGPPVALLAAGLVVLLLVPGAGAVPLGHRASVPATSARSGGSARGAGIAPGVAASAFTWANYTPFAPGGPSPRGDYGLAYDPVDQHLVLYGGLGCWARCNDTWTWANDTWTNISATAGPAPTARYDPSMAWDSEDGYILLFGGSPGVNIGAQDTYSFLHGQWKALHPTTAPASRYEAALADDPAAGTMILFGGSYGGAGTYYNDTWSYLAGNWTQLSPNGTPAPPRRGMAYDYDAADRAIILFGGTGPNFIGESDTYAFANDTWTLLTPTLSPPGRWLGSSAYDPTLGGLVINSGSTSQGCVNMVTDTWLYAGGSWTNLSATSSDPPGHCGATMAYDPDGTGGVFFGGANIYGSTVDATWGFYAGPHARLTGAAVVDAGQNVTLRTATVGGVAPLGYAYAGLPAGCASVNAPSLTCAPTAAGAYNVSVQVIDAKSGTATATVALTVDPALVATFAFSPDAIDAGQSVTFRLNATGGSGGDRYQYVGLPSGCSSINLTSLVCAPTTPGTYAVHGVVVDRVGGTAVTAPLPLAVAADLAPTVAIAPVVDDVGVPGTATVTVTGGTPPSTVSWTGLPTGCASANQTTLACLPTGPGAFLPTASVVDATGAVANATGPVWLVHADPRATVTANLPEATTGVAFVFTATVVNGTGPYAYVWAFGDGTNTSTVGGAAVHAFTANGTYVVGVVVIDHLGVAATAGVTVAVTPALAVAVTASAATVTATATLTLLATVSGGAPPYTVSWAGAPPACEPAIGPTVTCVPTGSGIFAVVATVSDALNGSVSASTSVRVNPVPVLDAQATPASGCDRTVNVTAAVTSGGTAPFAYAWAFGDASTGGGARTNHSYAVSGTYAITASATDASGVTVFHNVSVTVAVPNDCAGSTAVPTGGSGLGTLELAALAIAAAAIIGGAAGAFLVARRRRRPVDPPAEPATGEFADPAADVVPDDEPPP